MLKNTDAFSAFESFLDSSLKDIEPKDTFATFEAFLDESIATLEAFNSVDAGLSEAIESLLCPDCVSKLLAQVKSNVDSKCKTIEDCDAMMEKVKQEAVKFNDCLEKMAEAAKGFKAGSVSKDELANIVNPCVTELRQSCDVLKLGEDCVDSTQDVSDDDVANLRAFIIGTRDIIAKRKEELDTSAEAPKDQTNGENTNDDASKADLAGVDPNAPKEAKESQLFTSDIEVMEYVTEGMNADDFGTFMTDDFDIADEGANWDMYTQVKSDMAIAKACVKQAKSLHKSGDYRGSNKKFDEAIAKLKASKEAVNKMPQDVSTAIFGYFAASFQNFGKLLLLSLVTFGIGTYAVVIKRSVQFWVGVAQLIAKLIKHEDVTAADFNMYTSRIKMDLDLYIRIITDMKKKNNEPVEKKPAKEAAIDELDSAIESFLGDVSSLTIDK